MNAIKYHSEFPPLNIEWERIIPLLGKTYGAIARYDTMLEVIHNKEVLLTPLTMKEAESSSRIEGTQATIAEVLQFEAQGDDKELPENKKNDIQEILNYRNAMLSAVADLEKFPISSRVILQAHEKLMNSVRGHNKSPGAYRKIANWIGPAGCTIENADYVSPAANEIPKLISRWEKFIHEEYKDNLVQLALMHAEFEAIHPFLDGNGRLGRMLIPLYMYEKELIRTPAFYISVYLEMNRERYYEHLRGVSRDGNWTGWCEFFLQALYTQAQDNLDKVTHIWNLYNSLKETLPKAIRSQFTIDILDAIFQSPIFRLSQFVRNLGISEPSARRLIKIMEDEGILSMSVPPRGRRSAIMIFPELLNIAEGIEVF